MRFTLRITDDVTTSYLGLLPNKKFYLLKRQIEKISKKEEEKKKRNNIIYSSFHNFLQDNLYNPSNFSFKPTTHPLDFFLPASRGVDFFKIGNSIWIGKLITRFSPLQKRRKRLNEWKNMYKTKVVTWIPQGWGLQARDQHCSLLLLWSLVVHRSLTVKCKIVNRRNNEGYGIYRGRWPTRITLPFAKGLWKQHAYMYVSIYTYMVFWFSVSFPETNWGIMTRNFSPGKGAQNRLAAFNQTRDLKFK